MPALLLDQGCILARELDRPLQITQLHVRLRPKTGPQQAAGQQGGQPQQGHHRIEQPHADGERKSDPGGDTSGDQHRRALGKQLAEKDERQQRARRRRARPASRPIPVRSAVRQSRRSRNRPCCTSSSTAIRPTGGDRGSGAIRRPPARTARHRPTRGGHSSANRRAPPRWPKKSPNRRPRPAWPAAMATCRSARARCSHSCRFVSFVVEFLPATLGSTRPPPPWCAPSRYRTRKPPAPTWPPRRSRKRRKPPGTPSARDCATGNW